MPKIKTHSEANLSKYQNSTKWQTAEIQENPYLVNTRGKQVKSSYRGRKYEVKEAYYRDYSKVERVARGCLGVVLTVVSCFTLLASKSVRGLFSDKGKLVYLVSPWNDAPLPENQNLDDHEIALHQTSNKQIKTDYEITNNLTSRGFKRKENRGNGRCLFYSIAPQITKDDLEAIKARQDLNQLTYEEWRNLNPKQQADQLRGWAMAEETRFFEALNHEGELPDPDKLWIEELYKDIKQELEKPSNQVIRSLCSTDLESKKIYCINNFEKYKKNTSRVNNWAGTSEFIALLNIFQRSGAMYGNDYARSVTVDLDEYGNVLPYFEKFTPGTPTIFVYQTNGGGHYEELERNNG